MLCQPTRPSWNQCVLYYKTIAVVQFWDTELLALAPENLQKYPEQMSNNTMVNCYTPEPNAPCKRYLPNGLLQQVVQWYHFAPFHAEMKILYNTTSLYFYSH